MFRSLPRIMEDHDLLLHATQAHVLPFSAVLKSQSNESLEMLWYAA